jgi:anti-anti-sigma factor
MSILSASLVPGSEGDPDVLYLTGELDVFCAQEIEARIEAHERSRRALTIDMKGCTYADSTILSVLVQAAKRYGNRLKIRVPSSGVVPRILAISELDRFLPIAD